MRQIHEAEHSSKLETAKIFDIMETKFLSPCFNVLPFGGTFVKLCNSRDNHKYLCMEALRTDIKNKEVLKNYFIK